VVATIKFPEGTTYRQQYTLYDETGQVIDLTGAELEFAAFTPSQSRTGVVAPFLSKQIGSGVSVNDPATDGALIITFNPADTVDKAGVYEWELELREINGDVWQAGSGVLVVQPGRRLDA